MSYEKWQPFRLGLNVLKLSLLHTKYRVFDYSMCQIHFIQSAYCSPVAATSFIYLGWSTHHKGRTVPLLKPPQIPHCILGEVDHAKNSPPPLTTRQARSYRANWATQTLLFSKPFDLAQGCHGNKICSKPALTWKLTLVLAFPAHCISN